VCCQRLTAVDEAASIDVLCSDKTGTLTRNELSVTSVRPLPGFDEASVLGLAALASSEGGQDSVDKAIRDAASHKPASGMPKLVKFVPFDPAKKTSEATATDAKGIEERIIKGAYTAVVALTSASPAAAGIVDELEKQGFRVLAVAAGPTASVQIVGMIALSDPPRSDSTSLISELHTLGVVTVMVTGDAPATAAIVAHDVGLTGAVCPPGKILRYSRAFCLKASMTLLKPFRNLDMRLECAAMAPMTHLRFVRRRSVLRFRQLPMSPNLLPVLC
jgi:H+-transporting ATPase